MTLATERTYTPEQTLSQLLDLYENAGPAIQDKDLVAFVAALANSKLGRPVRPSHIDELLEFRDSRDHYEDDTDFRFWERRYDDLTWSILHGERAS